MMTGSQDNAYSGSLDPNGYMTAQYNPGVSGGSHLGFTGDASGGHTSYDQHTSYSAGGAMYGNAATYHNSQAASYNQSGAYGDSLSSGGNPATFSGYRAAVAGSVSSQSSVSQLTGMEMSNEGGWFSIEDDLIICMQNAVNDDDFTRTETWLKKSNSKRGIGKVRTAEEAKARYKVLCETGIKDKRLLDHKVIGTISTLKKSIQQNINKQERHSQHQQQMQQQQLNALVGNEPVGGDGGGNVEASVIVNLNSDLHMSEH